MTVYEENGFNNREDYLESLAVMFDLPVDTVMATAELLGETEDFDGLVSTLEDASDFF